MSLKMAAKSWPKTPLETLEESLVVVREYDEERHKIEVEKMERLCEVGQGGKPSLVTDLMGDPICRIRHFPIHVMLVAEYGEEGEVVGVIRGCLKTVTRGDSVYVKLAYLLGLRVSPAHRRLGIGTKLIQHLEEWSKQNGAEYAYMATDCTNEPSINLFTKKCGYSKFRTLTMLVQPVHAHHKPIMSDIAILRLPPKLAASIYNRIFADSEFYPHDIDAILTNKLNLGTFMAIPKQNNKKNKTLTNAMVLPADYAIVSVWNTKEVFKLEVRGASAVARGLCEATRVVDRWLPWLRVPSFPDVFRQFGVYVMYGGYMEGKRGKKLMKGVCEFVHNMAKDEGGCGAIVGEVAKWDPVIEGVPHWKRFSWDEDVWCIKKFQENKKKKKHEEEDEEEEGDDGKCGPLDWIASRSSSSSSSSSCSFSSASSSRVIFVDPRDF